MKKKYIIISFFILLIPVLIWISSLVKCEVLTQKYYDDFALAYTQTTMLGDMEYFKVLRCDGETAEVYYVSKGRAGADVLTFENRNGNWVGTSWEAVWSTSGSASDVIYPYWWHFIFGGF